MNIQHHCVELSLADVSIKHCGQTHHVPVIVREVKQILNKAIMYILVLCWKGLGRDLMHNLTGIRE